MQHKIAVLSPSFSKNETLRAELEALGLPVKFNTGGPVLKGDGVAAFVNSAAANIALVGTEKIMPEILDQCPQLKFIGKYGVGRDNIDEAELARRKIGFGWTPGTNKRSVTELVLAFALGHYRNVSESIAAMKAGNWKKDGGVQLSDRTVGIVGLGNVGTDLAGILGALGCRLLVTDIVDKASEAKALGAEVVSYEQLLRGSDMITFHVPATAQTHHMYGPAQIGLTKNDAFVVNTARGVVVDFAATVAAVKAGQLGGFACDVFEHEPFDASGLSETAHLYFTPHIGGNAQEAVLSMGRAAIAHIRSFCGLDA